MGTRITLLALAVVGSAMASAGARAQVDAPPPPTLSPIPGFLPSVSPVAPSPPAPTAQPPGPPPSQPADPRERVTVEGANEATFGVAGPAEQRNLIVKLQVLLDRAGVSPGVIDGYPGENVAKSISAFEAVYGFPVDGLLDAEIWNVLNSDAAPVLVPYTVTADDLAGPFLGVVPRDYAEMARLDRVGYANAGEMLAERFHMDIDLFVELNPGLETLAVGSALTVASIGTDIGGAVARLEADRSLGQVRGYDAEGRLIVAYPATIGSADTPSPSGTHLVTVVVLDASYSYRPAVNFQQGNNTAALTIPPGPNNPVGGIWIDLSEPTYGIHGAPEPSLIDKTFSHGCVRLTNWDARELAGMVREGVPVDFL